MDEWERGEPAAALKLLELAAGWGNKNAQYTLGLIYYNGHHVAANRALGLAWLELADERANDAQIGEVLRAASRSATAAERQQAQQLFARMQGTYADKVAAARAWHRLQHWRASHARNGNGCLLVQGAQAVAARKLGLVADAPESEGSGVASMPVRIPENSAAQPLMGEPIYRRLHARATPQAMQDAQAVRQQRAQGKQFVDGACVPVQVQRQLVQASADDYFHGLTDRVEVGPLQQVPAPAASSAH